MLGNKIDETLTDLDYNTLYTMAEWHDKQSTILRARAQTLAERKHMHDEVSRRAEYIFNSPKIVMKYLRQGHSADIAIFKAAEHSGLPEKTIRANWLRFLDDKKREAVKERNMLAFEMHGLGISNVEIAARLDLHPVTVSRILKNERKKRLVKNPNPNKIKFFRDAIREMRDCESNNAAVMR